MGTDIAATEPTVEEVALNKAINDNRDQAESNRRRIEELIQKAEAHPEHCDEYKLIQREIARLDDEQLDLYADWLLMSEQLEDLQQQNPIFTQ